jgi:DNA (cytosine-5)-methyltransferase 1
VSDTLIASQEANNVPVQRPEGGNRPLLLSVFSGSGGLDLGFWQAGYKVVLAADIFPAAVATHERNHGPHGTVTKNLDLSTTTYEQLAKMWSDLTDQRPVGIIGGPPCQAFSVSNVHQHDDDPRRLMLRHYAQFVEGFNRDFGLDFFLLENVTGLLDEKHAQTFIQFKELCSNAGFDITEKVIDAVHFGIPQYRERLIVVGINRRRFPGLEFSIPEGDLSECPSIDTLLSNLPEPVVNARHMTQEDIPFHPNHWTFKVKSAKFTDGSIQPGKALGRSFRALKWGQPSWTVAYGHREVHVHPNCNRRLSIYEAMLLQGFPHDYVLESNISDQVVLVSDAVPPPIGKATANAIGVALNHNLQGQQVENNNTAEAVTVV